MAAIFLSLFFPSNPPLNLPCSVSHLTKQYFNLASNIVQSSGWCDAGNSKSNQFYPLLLWQLTNECKSLLHLQTSVILSHLSVLSGTLPAQSLPPVFLCWTESYLQHLSQHGWQGSIWWHEQVETNIVTSSLSVRYRWIVEMKITCSEAN